MKTIVHTPTNNLANSIDFYTKLKFNLLSEKTLTRFSEGKFVLEVNPERTARAGIKLLGTDWQSTCKKIEPLTKVMPQNDGFLVSDPNGVWIYLVSSDEDIVLPESENSVLGNFGGMSIETVDIERTLEFWLLLGFEVKSGKAEQGWFGLQNTDGFELSLMNPNICPHLFFNPGLNFFNGKNNPGIIEEVRRLNIPITEEITHFNKEGIVDNIIIRDPGGLGFFIFND